MLLNKGEVLALPSKSEGIETLPILSGFMRSTKGGGSRWMRAQALESEDEGWIHSCAINKRTVLDMRYLIPSSLAS